MSQATKEKMLQGNFNEIGRQSCEQLMTQEQIGETRQSIHAIKPQIRFQCERDVCHNVMIHFYAIKHYC
jgi:hypothetical protein